MGNKIKSLGYEMQRVIDLGLIDNWLRGLSEITPRPLSRDAADYADDFNTHLIAYDCIEGIEPAHIQNLQGCRQLLTTCDKRDVSVEVKILDDGHLSVAFQPENQFKSSRVFGASYHNVTPAPFARSGRRNEGMT